MIERGAVTRQKLRVVDDNAVSASFERLAAHVDRHRLVAEGRVESDAEVGELADGRVDVARVGVAEHQRVGQLGIRRQVGPGRGADRLCAISDSRRVLPSSSRTAILARSCLRVSFSSCSTSGLPGLSSKASWNSISASSSLPVAARRRAVVK